MEKIEKNYGIQGVRCIACVMILLHHLSAAFNAGFVDTLGRCAVSLFIVITGFLTGMYKEPGGFLDAGIVTGIRNVLKKIRKFYWIYFISFLIGCAAIYVHPDISDGGNFVVKCVMFLLMIQSWVPEEEIYFAINPVCWYMSVVVFFAFCEPFILKMIFRMSAKIKIISALIIFAGLVILTLIFKNSEYCGWVLYIFPLARFGDFYCALIAGNIYANYKSEIKISKRTSTFLEIATVIILMLSLFINIPVEWQYNVLYLPVAMILVIVFAMQNGFLSKIADHTLLLRFADISCIIFIIHQLVYMAVHMVNKYLLHFSTALICIVAVMVAVIGAMLLRAMHSFFVYKFRRMK